MEEFKRKQVLKQAKDVFFEAMLDGYTGEQKNSIKIVSPDGRKTITFINGKFKVIDEYWTTPESDLSAGMTTILYEVVPSRGIPIWWMSYGGRYPKELIPFLKESLKLTYERREFRGGRGPNSHLRGNLEYVNSCSAGGFEKFEGNEEIIDLNNNDEMDPDGLTVVGFHKYFGMSLI